MQQKKKHELAFRQPPGRKAAGAITVEGGGKRQDPKAKRDAVPVAPALPCRVVQKGAMFRFDIHNATYN